MFAGAASTAIAIAVHQQYERTGACGAFAEEFVVGEVHGAVTWWLRLPRTVGHTSLRRWCADAVLVVLRSKGMFYAPLVVGPDEVQHGGGHTVRSQDLATWQQAP